jgi:hypothetical protein
MLKESLATDYCVGEISFEVHQGVAPEWATVGGVVEGGANAVPELISAGGQCRAGDGDSNAGKDSKGSLVGCLASARL